MAQAQVFTASSSIAVIPLPTDSQKFVLITENIIEGNLVWEVTNEATCTNAPPYQEGPPPVTTVNPGAPFNDEYDFQLQATLVYYAGSSSAPAPTIGIWSVPTTADGVASVNDTTILPYQPNITGSATGSATATFMPSGGSAPSITTTSATCSYPNGASNYSTSGAGSLQFTQVVSQADWYRDPKLGDDYWVATIKSGVMTTNTTGSVDFPSNV